MFDNADNLGNHLVQDGFFRPWDRNHGNSITDDHTLLILDDYNTSNMVDPVCRDFYTNAFRQTTAQRIIILYQGHIPKNNYILTKWAEYIDVDAPVLWSYLCACIKKKMGKSLADTVRKSYDSRDLHKNTYAACDFIHEMSLNGIDVSYSLYENDSFDPPFHGRYWLDNNVGYIVDGSLNNYGNKKVFAQKMDDENYEIIRHIVQNDVLNHAAPGLNESDFDRILRKIGDNRERLFSPN